MNSIPDIVLHIKNKNAKPENERHSWLGMVWYVVIQYVFMCIWTRTKYFSLRTRAKKCTEKAQKAHKLLHFIYTPACVCIHLIHVCENRICNLQFLSLLTSVTCFSVLSPVACKHYTRCLIPRLPINSIRIQFVQIKLTIFSCCNVDIIAPEPESSKRVIGESLRG